MFAAKERDYGIVKPSVRCDIFYDAVARLLIFIGTGGCIAVTHHTFELPSSVIDTNDLSYYLTL